MEALRWAEMLSEDGRDTLMDQTMEVVKAFWKIVWTQLSGFFIPLQMVEELPDGFISL